MERLFETQELTGEVLGVVYADGATGFGVVELAPDGRDEGARCVGPLSDLVEGQTVRLVGRWADHPRYGPTFEATLYEQTTPSTVAGLRTFLRSERFAEIPDVAIERALVVFGSATGGVIEHDPDRLVREAGLDPADADALHAAWLEGLALAELIRFTEPARLPNDVVRAVHARFGADATRIAADDPYALLEVDRCRFAHADALARVLGIASSDPRRLVAGARAAVAAARRRDGHQHLPRAVAVDAAAGLLGVDVVAAAHGLEQAVATGALVEERLGDGTIAVTTPAGRAAEVDLASDLLRLREAKHPRLVPHAGDVNPSDELTAGQRQAVEVVFTTPVAVLTGGPGTGKTRTVEEVVRAAEAAGMNVALCAPTGRAAKRLEELVRRPATTVHRLLEARPLPEGGFAFRYGAGDRLPHDLIVCDEVSMCDTELAGALLGAIEDGAHLLLVGDPDQLPSVGPGDVLRDVVASEVVPVVTLTEVHRQAAASRIVSLAHEINRGEVGVLKGRDGDVFLAEAPRNGVVARVVEAVANRVPEYFGVTPASIQVIAPIYRGPVGVDALNGALRAALNPAQPGEPEVAGFRLGDRVMQTRNDTDLDVSNGDVGSVVDLRSSKGELRVAFPRGEVTYGRRQARDLTHAWAITVHKSQGGEWPVVVLVVDGSHRGMLWRNLVYTAVTRAQRALIVVGQAEAVRVAARADRPRNRHTALTWRLRTGAGAVLRDGAA